MNGADNTQMNTLPRWDDLEAFGVIARGIREGRTLQQIGEDPIHNFKSARMLYLHLSRLEEELGHRLVNRKPWSRDITLTKAGKRLEQRVLDLTGVRQQIHEDFACPELPIIRIVTNAPSFLAVIPEALNGHSGKQPAPKLGLRVEFLHVDFYPEAIAALVKRVVDIGLCAMRPGEENTVPRNNKVRHEQLLRSEILALVHIDHPFAQSMKDRDGITVDELANEHIIARRIYEPFFPQEVVNGDWTQVTHSRDVYPYIRMKIGVGINTRLAFNLMGAPKDIVAVPIKPPIYLRWFLLRSRKQWPPFSRQAQEFIEKVQSYYSQVGENSSWLARKHVSI